MMTFHINFNLQIYIDYRLIHKVAAYLYDVTYRFFYSIDMHAYYITQVHSFNYSLKIDKRLIN